MSKEVNLATLGKFAEAVNTGNFDLFNDTVASGCVDHDPAPGQEPGPDYLWSRLNGASLSGFRVR